MIEQCACIVSLMINGLVKLTKNVHRKVLSRYRAEQLMRSLYCHIQPTFLFLFSNRRLSLVLWPILSDQVPSGCLVRIYTERPTSSSKNINVLFHNVCTFDSQTSFKKQLETRECKFTNIKIYRKSKLHACRPKYNRWKGAKIWVLLRRAVSCKLRQGRQVNEVNSF